MDGQPVQIEALHWSYNEDDECIEDCPGCTRERVIRLVASADSGNYGQVGEEEATQLVDLLLAAMFDQSTRLAAVGVPADQEAQK